MEYQIKEKSNLHLILGGQRSGKTAFAENLAAQWLKKENHHCIYVATAQAYDEEMQKRIIAHQKNRAEKYPKMQSQSAPLDLKSVFSGKLCSQTMILVDCLGMWLTNWIAPADIENQKNQREMVLQQWKNQRDAVLVTIMEYAGPVILVSNEVGLGVVPMGAVSRDFVDELGQLNQMLAARAGQVSAVVAGLPWWLKG